MLEPLESRIAPATVLAVDATNHLLTFNSASPNVISGNVAITGLNAGDIVEGIDFRPATGGLYALVVNGASARLGTLDITSGAFVQIAAAFAVSGTDFGFDFNPTNDRLRVVSDTDINLSIDPNTGGVTTQTELDPGNPNIVGSAYSNNFAGAATTTLYALDSNTDQLRIQNPPAAGTLSNVGPLGVDISGAAGFDITTGDTAFAALQTGGLSQLFTINLATGAATFLGAIGTGAAINGLAVLGPEVTLVNAKTATFTDVDGDLVTVQVSQGTLSKNDFVLVAEGAGAQLRAINFSDDGAEFAGANLTITAKRTALGGDGRVNLGYLNATGLDLGEVRLKGDLGAIDAGDASGLAGGLQLLKVNSLGRLGASTGAPDLVSSIQGALGSLQVRGSVQHAQLEVFATTGNTDGRIGAIAIGGDLIGGGADDSGKIAATNGMGDVTIGGSILGGGGARSGRIASAGTLGDVTLGGSLEGGGGISSGEIFSASNVGIVRIGGDVTGAGAATTGAIDSQASIEKVVIQGSLVGRGGANSGSVFATGSIGKVKVGIDLRGGGGAKSGAIEAGLDLSAVVVKGAVSSGGGPLSGAIMADNNLGPVVIGKSVAGSAAAPVQVSGRSAIASVSIGGDASYLNVLAGYNDAVAEFSDARLGAIAVGGDWIASNAVAGVAAGIDGIFATADDTAIAGGNAAIVSRIASITIGGQVLGTPAATNSTDGFGFVAQQIGALQVSATAFPLITGPGNDGTAQLVGPTADTRLREVPLG